MKTEKLKVGQRVLWYDSPGQVVTVPKESWEEYGIKLDSGRIVFDLRGNLFTAADLEALSVREPILE
jgi:hypothetical protein